MTLREKYYEIAKASKKRNSSPKTSYDRTHMIAVEKYLTQKIEKNSNLGYFFCTLIIHTTNPPILSDGSELSLTDIIQFANSPEIDLTTQHYYLHLFSCHLISLFWDQKSW